MIEHDISALLRNASIMTESSDAISSLASYIDSKNFDQTYSKYFPKLHAKYGKISNAPPVLTKIGVKAKLDKTLTSYIKSKIDQKNSSVDVNVYVMKDKSPNAFTIPGITLGMSARDVTFAKMIFGSFTARNYDVTGDVSKTGKIILGANTKIQPIIVMTSGIASNSRWSKDEKLAIIMHEIGHWSTATTDIQKVGSFPKIARLISTLSAVVAAYAQDFTRNVSARSNLHHMMMVALSVAIVSMIFDTTLSRAAEFRADAFAKAVGRGTDLSTSLQKLSGENDSTVIKNKVDLEATISPISKMLMPIIDALTLSTHPNTDRRNSRLLESALSVAIAEGEITDAVVSKLHKVAETVSSKIDSALAAAPTNPLLWAFSSK